MVINFITTNKSLPECLFLQEEEFFKGRVKIVKKEHIKKNTKIKDKLASFLKKATHLTSED